MPTPTTTFVYSPDYGVDIGGHVFNTDKYRLIVERLTAEHGIAPESILAPAPAETELLVRALDTEYLADLENLRWTARTMTSELPISRTIVDAAFLCVGGTTLAARQALKTGGIGFHVGGGWHHAFRDHAEGFCYVNDIAATVLGLHWDGAVDRAMVVDCDLHQGNGTAHYFLHDPRVFTFSIHQENLYPAKQRSDLDIGLEDFAGDDVYLDRLGSAIPRIYDEHRPEIVFYVAGADPFVEDQLGSLQVTKQGLRARDDRVIGEAAQREIPVVVVLAGGYAPDVNDTVDIHIGTAKAALALANSND